MCKPSEARLKSINGVLQEWRQGDCVLGDHWFAYRINPDCPLSPEAKEAAAAEVDLAEAALCGLAVVTQTCDIVRLCSERPFVEVCPLVSVDQTRLNEVYKARRPNYAYIPGVAQHSLVADLDRVMTVEKAVLAGWERVSGFSFDEEARRLALCLARKRRRFAFPDDFIRLVAPLQRRLQKKHEKGSQEGRALRALREIRVRAAPSWDAEKVELHFLFVPNANEASFEGESWSSLLDCWLKCVNAQERFTRVDGVVMAVDRLSAKDYIESDPLDLGHLSGVGN